MSQEDYPSNPIPTLDRLSRPADPAPACVRLVARHPIRHALGREEAAVRRTIPGVEPSESQSAIAVFGQGQRVFRHIGLSHRQIDPVGPALGRDGDSHLPPFEQNGSEHLRSQIHIAVQRLDLGPIGRLARPEPLDHLHPTLLFTHVPEVRLAAIDLGPRPRSPDTMMVQMVLRIIARNHSAQRAHQRMQIARPAVLLGHPGRQNSMPTAVGHHGLGSELEGHRALAAFQSYRIPTGLRGGRGRARRLNQKPQAPQDNSGAPAQSITRATPWRGMSEIGPAEFYGLGHALITHHRPEASRKVHRQFAPGLQRLGDTANRLSFG